MSQSLRDGMASYGPMPAAYKRKTDMKEKVYTFQAVIEPVPEKGGAYIRFPYDVRKEFGKGL